MTQQELDLKAIQLYNDYTAKATPIKRKMKDLDTDTRAKFQSIHGLYGEINANRDRRSDLESVLRDLKADYLNALQAARQELNVSNPQEPANP